MRNPKYYPAAVPELMPFQRRLMATLNSEEYDTFAWSMPRGNAKSFMGALALMDFVLPESPRFQRNLQCLFLAASLDQARVMLGYLRTWLDDRSEDYVFSDSVNQVSVRHRPSNARIKAISSKAKTAMGIVNVPWVVADEPGAWETVGGELMKSALNTAQGKMGSDLKILYIGTRAPAMDGWWIDMLADGTRKRDGVFVYDLRADESKWNDWKEIRRVNPVLASHPKGVKILRKEFRQAHSNPSDKAEFLSFRLNIPTHPESDALLKPHYWEAALKRPVAERSKWFALGMDIGANRAWTAAVAMWDTGRVEALALAPGIPSIRDQERRDRVSRGTYQRLVDTGRLIVCEGREEPDPDDLVRMVGEMWGEPDCCRCDRFRLSRVRDAAPDWYIQPRKMNFWSEATYDIDALRQLAVDGPMSVERESLRLLTHSVKVAKVRPDDQGSVRLVKRGTNNEARDDVAAALLLAAGWFREEWYEERAESA